ncbi:DUF4352 domain-containing protein [Staphylococcus pettenkoferi]|uniref:DUF4352 domain-containing protein n=1 Tax=Staphylococcus pettenkoferi TaxID=170573 RepID=UPI002275F4BF|nr:DUF4352 domain-containing protein [Staphylococcus pettenkoferi]MCY1589832.1 DUF4352 domain-containing protein [Staphylococcus pettenkoferi]MCY1599222.1 DUF4352 domain-containing protein [Staphylococcus pettenkoferi]MCY1613804.1 DUF4352 domain-containing protein [Staphylococcus pettenkoferi]
MSEQSNYKERHPQRSTSKARPKPAHKPKKWPMIVTISAVIILLLAAGIIALILFLKSGTPYSSRADKAYKVGQTAKNGDLEVTVKSASKSKQVGPSITPTTAKGTYIVVDVKIKNKGKEALTVDSTMFELLSEGKTLKADGTASVMANTDDNGENSNSFFLEQVNPDSTAEGKIVFDVSSKVAKSKDKKLKISSNLFSTQYVTFKLPKLTSSDDEATDDEESDTEEEADSANDAATQGTGHVAQPRNSGNTSQGTARRSHSDDSTASKAQDKDDSDTKAQNNRINRLHLSQHQSRISKHQTNKVMQIKLRNNLHHRTITQMEQLLATPINQATINK